MAVSFRLGMLASHRGNRTELLRKLLERMWHHLMQPGTADLLTRFVQVHQKEAWFLREMLG